MQGRDAADHDSLNQRAGLSCTKVPYIPPEVSLEDVGPDFFLLDQTSRQYIDINLASKDNLRVTKDSCSSFLAFPKYSILIHDKQKYIIYKGGKSGHLAGSGTFADVKYLQHLQTGEWYALKSMSEKILDEEGLVPFSVHEITQCVADEHAMQRALNLAVGNYGTRHSKSKGFQAYLLMKAAKGQELFNFLETDNIRTRMHFMHLLDIFIQMAKSLQFMHDKYLIHRDFKTENIRFYFPEGLVSLIDYGSALQFSVDKQEVKITKLAGSPRTVAPEAFSGTCSTGSDVYALGVEIASQMDFLIWKMGSRYKALHPAMTALERGFSVTQDRQALLNLYKLCENLMSDNVKERFQLPEVIRQLMQIQQQALTIPVMVGMIDLNLYFQKCTAAQELEVHELSRCCHEVVLIAETGFQIKPEIVALMRKIEKQAVRVYDRIYHTRDAAKIMSELMQNSPAIKREWRKLPAVVSVTNESVFAQRDAMPDQGINVKARGKCVIL